MKIWKRLMKVAAGIAAVLILIVGVLFMLPARTPQIEADGKKVPGSIAEIKKVNIGGMEQTLLIRGHNRQNPVILFLHGGPGQSDIGMIRNYQEELEKEFVVVRWDQRGAGASYSKDIPEESFTIEQFLQDADEVTDYLRDRFDQSRIFISGHSWGTVLGTLAVQRHPDKYSAYISVGQVVNMKENEKIAYSFALQRAKEEQDTDAIQELENVELLYTFDNMMSYRKYVSKFGGVIHTEPEKGLMSSLLFSSEYRLIDKLSYQSRIIKSGKRLNDEIMSVNLMEDVKQLEVPTYFIIGKHDYTTAYTLVEQFCEQLKAPDKELIVFENSAHLPQLEESEKFNRTLIGIKEQIKD
ncbi:alpha/beta hydrolase [Paenibacillus sp. J5C_2022]|uniref:alpha/beta fold hydrolase n=1 Tax=Paenibacillus sp. J5C2022 TaxID=2977129 RepID=UPI0021D2957B|nr:alpha/beta hydrolase [Paenibacillus sp. J5C2022]MCU6712130.1 alpha/beta hydrolase [Paenibacillus sp. J5C2022]